MTTNNSEHLAQLYTYDVSTFDISKNTIPHFASNFTLVKMEKEKVNWLNFHSIEDRESIEKTCDNLGIEKQTIDDIYKIQKRPKLEDFDSYFFFSIQSALPREDLKDELQEERISFIVGKNYLLSFQEKKSDHFVEVRNRIELNRGKIRQKGPDFLLFRMLDAITDNYFEVLDSILERVEELDNRLMEKAESSTLKEIEFEKRKLIDLRKVVYPLKEITSQLEKMKCPYLEEENEHYFSELKDNCLTILEDIDAYKQVLEGMANLYYAIQDMQMNEIMKLLTIVSTIFIPLTFIAGIYGMNFQNIPELRMHNGYFYTWGLMIFIVVALLFYFGKKGWLKWK